MIGRNVGRAQISDMIADLYLADSLDQQIALTDIIMDQLTSIPATELTVGRIRRVIETEIAVWMRMQKHG